MPVEINITTMKTAMASAAVAESSAQSASTYVANFPSSSDPEILRAYVADLALAIRDLVVAVAALKGAVAQIIDSVE